MLAYRLGQPLPERIANAPELHLGLELYLQAYFDLDSERSNGMGVGRIFWTSIADYAKAFDLDEDQTDDLFYFIRAMDNANLKRIAEQLEKK